MPGLYLHIPFCTKKCHYCNFVITLSGDGTKESRFLSLLEKEMAYRAPELKGKRLETLYFGGGTPSVLSQKDLVRLFSIVHRYFSFQKNVEVTLEANPGDITLSKALLLKKMGVTRVSLGAQTFHDKTLVKLNRAHRAADIYQSYDALRGAGFDNINLDLMLSLPGESLQDVSHSLSELKRLDPEHVSVYELVIEDHTVFGRRAAQGKSLALPAEPEQIAMLSAARAFLTQNGWLQYELLNYAKRGFESHHNQLYWKNEEYLGLGPGAYSYLDGKRSLYAASFDEYLKKVDVSDWSYHEQETLTAVQRQAESFLLALRTSRGVRLREGGAYLKRVKKTADDFFKKGWIKKTKSHLSISAQGQLFAETIFSGFSFPDGRGQPSTVDGLIPPITR